MMGLLRTFFWFLAAGVLWDGLEGSPYCSDSVDSSGGPWSSGLEFR